VRIETCRSFGSGGHLANGDGTQSWHDRAARRAGERWPPAVAGTQMRVGIDGQAQKCGAGRAGSASCFLLG